MEPCGEIDGVRYVNDSKATNTDAVEKALTAFPDDDVILLLGGHDKGTPLTDFARVVMDNVRSVVCFGDARERFTAAMDEADVDGDVDIAQADDLRDAVDVARSLSSRGDVICFLLPALRSMSSRAMRSAAACLRTTWLSLPLQRNHKWNRGCGERGEPPTRYEEARLGPCFLTAHHTAFRPRRAVV
ncbi:MAG: cyanophycin synthetase [Collinsella sp.]